MNCNVPIFNTRDELLPYLINSYSIEYGLEIGVRDGYFSEFILDKAHTNFKLIGIDIYTSPRINQILQKYKERYQFISNYSHVAAQYFEDNSLKFIHIDAGHSFDDVSLDLRSWWPKLKSGGFFSGDDYCICNNPSEGQYGVVDAVEQWAESINVSDIYLTQIGFQNKDERFKLAKLRGKQVENNLRGLEYTENAWVPNWMIIKQ